MDILLRTHLCCTIASLICYAYVTISDYEKYLRYYCLTGTIMNFSFLVSHLIDQISLK